MKVGLSERHHLRGGGAGAPRDVSHQNLGGLSLAGPALAWSARAWGLGLEVKHAAFCTKHHALPWRAGLVSA